MESGAEKYRLFVAIHVPNAVKDRILESQRELKTAAGESVRWTSPEQLHLTLLFLGNVEVSELGNLQTAFENASREGEKMRLSMEGLGCFPNQRRPRVIWAGVQGDADKLKALQSELQKVLQRWCEKEESREYRPHLTLGRVREGARVRNLGEAISTKSAVTFGNFDAEGCSLMRSQLSSQGSIYTELAKGMFG